MIRLGVNIDHVATVRNARGEKYPEPVHAAQCAELGGAENITFHLREDRRHIRDDDVWALKAGVHIPLNMELAARSDVLGIALKLKPHSVTLVPEKRAELTTEGGLDIRAGGKELTKVIQQFKDAGVLVALFVEPNRSLVKACQKIGADALEFHTGSYCKKFEAATSTVAKVRLLEPIQGAVAECRKMGMQAHLGHGLNYLNAHWMQLVEGAEEANIGHAIVSRALFVGMEAAVRHMHSLLNDPAHRPFTP